jgi:hypothetical protein
VSNFIWWCFFLLVVVRKKSLLLANRRGEQPVGQTPVSDKQKGRGSRISGSAALERACWLVA